MGKHGERVGCGVRVVIWALEGPAGWVTDDCENGRTTGVNDGVGTGGRREASSRFRRLGVPSVPTHISSWCTLRRWVSAAVRDRKARSHSAHLVGLTEVDAGAGELTRDARGEENGGGTRVSSKLSCVWPQQRKSEDSKLRGCVMR